MFLLPDSGFQGMGRYVGKLLLFFLNSLMFFLVWYCTESKDILVKVRNWYKQFYSYTAVKKDQKLRWVNKDLHTIKNLIDIDPISTRFWCESHLCPYIENVLRVQCFGLFRNYNLFQGNLHQRTTLYFVLVIIFI